MVRTNPVVAFTAILIAIFLSLPLALSFMTDHEDRARWEQGAISKFPPLLDYILRPEDAFDKLEAAVDDYQFGGLQIIRSRRSVLFDYLDTTGDKYVVKNKSGAVFLTAPFRSRERNNAFWWWRRNCILSRTDPGLSKIENSLRLAQRVLSSRGAEVVFAVAPSKSVALKDSLPRSTPSDIRSACQATSSENNWVGLLNERTDEFKMFYPFNEFYDRSNRDSSFFPNTAYHWEGESTWTFVESLTKELGILLNADFPKECKPREVPWDIGRVLGVRTTTPGCTRQVSEAYSWRRSKFAVRLPNGNRPDLAIWTSSLAGNEQQPTLLLISNSFGPPVRVAFAHAFSKVYHINQNDLRADQIHALLEQTDILDVDYVISIGADFHYPGVLENFIKHQKSD